MEGEGTFYRNLCDDLEWRLARLQGQHDHAQEDVRRSRTSTRLLREIHKIAGLDAPLAQISQQFLHIVLVVLSANRVAILKYSPDTNRFVPECDLGFASQVF